jgi:hypothetical protein
MKSFISFRYIIFLLLASFFTFSESRSQSKKPLNCDDISFETKITPSIQGRNSNAIQFINNKDDRSRFKIFLLNKGTDVAKKEISDRRLTNLPSGVYEFIIIDTREKGCFKEVTVRIPAQN